MRGARDLEQIAQAVRSASGISVKPNQYGSLDTAVTRALGNGDGLDFAAILQPGSEQLNRLVDEIAVKETTFLRDRSQLERLDWDALLDCARRHGHEEIRIWSAGCATGEEPYSLAVLACEAFPRQRPPVRIVGTDLSATALEAARLGRYRDRAVREVDQSLRDRYFSRDHGEFLIGDLARRLVHFQRHNLVVDPMPPPAVGECVAVVCRNVFIYFEPPTIERVLAGFQDTLVDEGVMILGATDMLAGGSIQTGAALHRAYDADRPEPTKSRSSASIGGDRVASPAHLRAEPPPDARLLQALAAAGSGRCAEALELAKVVLADNPLDSSAYFVRGLVELDLDQPMLAVTSLRAALYTDPTFGLAAFMLGRALDRCGGSAEARRAYEQTLRVLDVGDRRHDYLLAQVGLDDVAAASRQRLASNT